MILRLIKSREDLKLKIARQRFKALCAHCRKEYGGGGYAFMSRPEWLIDLFSETDLRALPFWKMKRLLGFTVLKTNRLAK